MASLMEDLADVLLQEDKQYQELIVLSKEKTDVLVAGNVKRLEEITAMEQEMTDVLHDMKCAAEPSYRIWQMYWVNQRMILPLRP